jgi:hypothetical protein
MSLSMAQLGARGLKGNLHPCPLSQVVPWPTASLLHVTKTISAQSISFPFPALPRHNRSAAPVGHPRTWHSTGTCNTISEHHHLCWVGKLTFKEAPVSCSWPFHSTDFRHTCQGRINRSVVLVDRTLSTCSFGGIEMCKVVCGLFFNHFGADTLGFQNHSRES